MPCGCNKRRNVGGAMPGNEPAPPEPRRTARQAVYRVMKDGEEVIATTSAKTARDEAKKIGASVKVTSRPVEAGEPAAV